MRMGSFSQSNNGIYRFIPTAEGINLGVIGKSLNPIDYVRDTARVRAAEKELIAGLTGVDKNNIFGINQVHGDTVMTIDDHSDREQNSEPEADGVITPLSGLCLLIRSADCVPVFFYDSGLHIIGAAHSGWRGTGLSIAQKTARRMKEIYGSREQDLRVWLLPSAGPESYEVGKEVAALFPHDITEKSGRLYLNLWQNIERSLIEEGIPAANIANSFMSTLIHRSEFFSHRGGDRGRNLNFCCREA